MKKIGKEPEGRPSKRRLMTITEWKKKCARIGVVVSFYLYTLTKFLKMELNTHDLRTNNT